MSKWTKKLPYTGTIHQGCLCCPPVEPKASMDMVIAVGFGTARVTKGNKLIFEEGYNDEGYSTLAEFEEMAKQDPDHDWQVFLYAPLRGRTYQRQGDGVWVLIDSNMGFA